MTPPKDNEPNEASAEETASMRDAAKASRQERSRGKVVDYSDAVAAGEKEIVEKMDALMDAIDRDPASFEAIISFGTAPLQELGKLSKDMLTVQGKFNDQVNIMGEAMDKLQNGMSGLNIEEFGEHARALAKGLAEAGSSGVKGLGKILNGFKGKKPVKNEHEQFIDDMQAALPDMLFEMIKLVENIKETDKGIEQVRKEAEKLGVARVEATREISLYLGATKEVLRRYNEEYIPNAQADFDESGDPEDELYLENIIKRKEDFIDRITILEGSRAQGIIAAKTLKQIIDTMEDQNKKVQDIILNSQPEWQAMLAAAAIAGSSLKAAQILQKADAFGDKMHDSTMLMIEESHQRTLDSRSRGTVDPTKLIEAASRLQLMIEKENTARADRLRRLEATADQLRGVTDRLIEAADSSNKARLLEATEAAKEDRGAEEPANENAPANKPARKPRGPRN